MRPSLTNINTLNIIAGELLLGDKRLNCMSFEVANKRVNILTGLAAYRWIIKILKAGKRSYFGYYCFAVVALAIIWALTQGS